MKVNISIDDVSPHPFSSMKVLKNCEKVVRHFPSVKFSLFIPIAYWRTIKPGIATSRPLFIYEYPDFCEALKSLSPENYEICFHGFYHGIPGKSDNDEFQHLTYDEALLKFSQINEAVKKSGLEHIFKPIFRPPAWRMSSGAIEAAKHVGINVLALSPKEYAKNTYCGADESFENVVYFTCNPPFDPLASHENNEIVYHACEWDRNYFSDEMSNDLIAWLHSQENVEFSFIGDLCHGKV